MRVIRGCLSYERCWFGREVDTRAMATNEETTPLVLAEEEQSFYKGEKGLESKHEEKAAVNNNEPEAACGYPAGLVGEGVVVGEPVPQARQPWSTSIFSCLGSNDEFCLSDMQVCLLGCVSPCVLYASNMELLSSGQESFVSHCMAYSSLYTMGQFLFGASLAPFFSFPSRVALRRTFNLEGHGEAFVKAVGCYSGLINSEEGREQCDSMCDFGLHWCCHTCALCQEGREIRRKIAQHGQRPNFYSLAAPAQQTME